MYVHVHIQQELSQLYNPKLILFLPLHLIISLSFHLLSLLIDMSYIRISYECFMLSIVAMYYYNLPRIVKGCLPIQDTSLFGLLASFFVTRALISLGILLPAKTILCFILSHISITLKSRSWSNFGK
jgi:hypothetical protein